MPQQPLRSEKTADDGSELLIAGKSRIKHLRGAQTSNGPKSKKVDSPFAGGNFGTAQGSLRSVAPDGV
jgi:hypothetical protein